MGVAVGVAGGCAGDWTGDGIEAAAGEVAAAGGGTVTVGIDAGFISPVDTAGVGVAVTWSGAVPTP